MVWELAKGGHLYFNEAHGLGWEGVGMGPVEIIFAPIWGIYFFSALQYFFTLWRRVYQQIRMEMYNASVTDDTNFTIYTYFYIYFKNTIAIF